MTELEFQYRAELREMRVLDGREAFEKLMVDGGLRLPFAEAYDAIEYECERRGLSTYATERLLDSFIGCVNNYHDDNLPEYDKDV